MLRKKLNKPTTDHHLMWLDGLRFSFSFYPFVLQKLIIQGPKKNQNDKKKSHTGNGDDSPYFCRI